MTFTFERLAFTLTGPSPCRILILSILIGSIESKPSTPSIPPMRWSNKPCTLEVEHLKKSGSLNWHVFNQTAVKNILLQIFAKTFSSSNIANFNLSRLMRNVTNFHYEFLTFFRNITSREFQNCHQTKHEFIHISHSRGSINVNNTKVQNSLKFTSKLCINL